MVIIFLTLNGSNQILENPNNFESILNNCKQVIGKTLSPIPFKMEDD